MPLYLSPLKRGIKSKTNKARSWNMLKKLPKTLLGFITLTLFTLNLFLGSVALYLLGFAKLITWGRWRKRIEIMIDRLASLWISTNSKIMAITSDTLWDVECPPLNPDDWYLVISNHRSWTDILVLQKIFNHKIPMLRFFVKKQLKWVPLLGSSCWIAGYPFMQRYSRDFIAKNPHLQDKDMIATHKACAKFKTIPVSIINFLEGTRFTPAKQQNQHSPYQHLLKPKAGGTAFALGAMGDCITTLLDVTLVYPQGNITIWDFFCNRVKKIIVRIETMPLTPDLRGDYNNDSHFRAYFQQWVNQLWQRKDEKINLILQNADS